MLNNELPMGLPKAPGQPAVRVSSAGIYSDMFVLIHLANCTSALRAVNARAVVDAID
jgi:hypothetical protein